MFASNWSKFRMPSFVRDLFNNVCSNLFRCLPKKSYRFDCNNVTSKYEICLVRDNEFLNCRQYSSKFEAFYVESMSGNKIACLMIKPFDRSKFTILFNHGGTVDIGNLCNFLYTFGLRLECNVFVYDYSGFGESNGLPTEKCVYYDAESALNVLIEKYQIPIGQIILYGQSLGTAAALHLASKHAINSVILHSPFLSAAKLYFPKIHSGYCRFYDFYKNVEMIEKTNAPILIIHGTLDNVVPIWHAKGLHQRCRNGLIPLWIDGGDHDNLYTFDCYMKRLKRFVEHDSRI